MFDSAAASFRKRDESTSSKQVSRSGTSNTLLTPCPAYVIKQSSVSSAIRELPSVVANTNGGRDPRVGRVRRVIAVLKPRVLKSSDRRTLEDSQRNPKPLVRTDKTQSLLADVHFDRPRTHQRARREPRPTAAGS